MSTSEATNTLREWRETAPYWAKHSAIIRAMFAPVTRALIEQARIIKGQRVLDVAGGPGEPSLTIAETVGPAGLVTCTDAVAEMVEAAQAEALRREVKNVEFRQCSADSLPFPDASFDAAVSRLGIMFFPDPVEGCREMLRVIKPEGVVAFAVWHEAELNPFAYIVTEVISRHVPTASTDPDAPGAFRFAELGKLALVMRQAGAADIRQRILRFEIQGPISPREFWAMRSQTSETLRTKLAKVSDQEKTQIGEEVQQAVAEFFPQNQMKFPAEMIIVTGYKAG